MVRKHGPPPLWGRKQGFPTLVQIILEQQVSLASAKAAFTKLESSLGEVSPEGLLTLDGDELKRIGFSRQKTRYSRGLAQAIVDGDLDLSGLRRLSDKEARETLMSLKGIGRWSADIYLLMALRRPDVWPTGDLALAKAAQQVKKLPDLPDHDDLDRLVVQADLQTEGLSTGHAQLQVGEGHHDDHGHDWSLDDLGPPPPIPFGLVLPSAQESAYRQQPYAEHACQAPGDDPAENHHHEDSAGLSVCDPAGDGHIDDHSDDSGHPSGYHTGPSGKKGVEEEA